MEILIFLIFVGYLFSKLFLSKRNKIKNYRKPRSNVRGRYGKRYRSNSYRPNLTQRSAKPYSGKSYINNPNPNSFLVYLVENTNLNTLKLGVGSWGRVNEILDTRAAPSRSAQKMGWTLLRAAIFSVNENEYERGREAAYEAEKRAHFYWRYVKRLPRTLDRNQMGFGEIEILGNPTFRPTPGYTETVALDKVCEVTTWNFVLNSPGLKKEHIPEGSRNLVRRDFDSEPKEIPPGYQEAQIRRINHHLKSENSSRFFTDEEKFWSKVEKTESCWNWLAATTKTGYGQGVYKGEVGPAHRISWTLEIGSDPGLFFLENRCGNRKCVRPEHWDLSLRRRSAPGEIRVSPFSCTNSGCTRPSRSMTKAGLCEPCRQKVKRLRRKVKESKSVLCANCGLSIELRGAPANTLRCTQCQK